VVCVSRRPQTLRNPLPSTMTPESTFGCVCFRDEYIFQLPCVIVGEVPPSGHATYIFAKAGPIHYPSYNPDPIHEPCGATIGCALAA
jgi:hypothetical protein